MLKVATIEDIREIEAKGMGAFLPDQSPYAMLLRARDRWPGATALRYVQTVDAPQDDLILSYDAFVQRVNRAGRLFQAHGVGPGDAVAILGGNTPGTQVALWAAEAVARACPINPMLKPDHIAALMAAAGCKLAVVLGENDEVPIWDTLVPALRAAGVSVPILDCDGARPSSGSDGALEHLAAQQDGADLPKPEDPGAIAALFHTGGTTGAPKLVQHTHLNQAHVARSCAVMYDLGPQDIILNGFPLFHVAGAFVYGLSAFSVGAQMIIPGRLGMRNQAFVQTIWQQVARYGVTVIGGVPTVISALNSVALDSDIPSLRLMLTGGSPLPAELADRFESLTNVPVRNILGMTETAGCIAVEPFHGPRNAGSCGLPLPFTEIGVLADDADTRPEQARSTTGIVAIRGPNISPGYTDDARNAGVFLNGGWLVSGDIGQVDDWGRLFISGRSKDIIIRGAHNLDPQAIEDALLTHPKLANAAAVGMPDAYAGELPVAFVQCKPDESLTPEALLAHARDTVPEPAAVPKRIEVIDEMPLTPIGKIFKPALRRIATRWAVEAVVAQSGVDAAAITIHVDEDLSTCVTAPDTLVAALREAFAGFPTPVRVVKQ